jgi:hypothetical protein
VQLTRKEQTAVQEKAQELLSSVQNEKELHLQQALSSSNALVSQLEISLTQKEEVGTVSPAFAVHVFFTAKRVCMPPIQELEESRRLYSAQKRALREALNAAAEREAEGKEAAEANRAVVAQAVEDELEKLQHELALVQARKIVNLL